MTDPTGESKERNRQIAHNEEVRRMASGIRISTWAIAVAIVIGLVAFGWIFLHNG